MKKIFFALFISSLILPFPAIATQPVIFENGDKGRFEFPRHRENSFAIINPLPSGGEGGYLLGTITPQTILRIVNHPEITKKNLDLLSGRQVLAWGKFKQVGSGEGTEVFCLEITIFLLPDKKN